MAGRPRRVVPADHSHLVQLQRGHHGSDALPGHQRQHSGLRTAKHGRTGLSSTFVGQSDFRSSLDAGLLVDALSTALLAWYRDNIRAGERPDGSGRQPELTEKVKNQRNRASQVRGYKTGSSPTTCGGTGSPGRPSRRRPGSFHRPQGTSTLPARRSGATAFQRPGRSQRDHPAGHQRVHRKRPRE